MLSSQCRGPWFNSWSENWISHATTKNLHVLSLSVVSDCLQPHGPYVAHQAPLSMGILQARTLPCPPPGYLPNPGIKPRFPTLQADSLPPESPGKSLPTTTKKTVSATTKMWSSQINKYFQKTHKAAHTSKLTVY